MSDDHHYAGGHELEGVNAANLFKIIFGLGLVTLLAATAVVQWFYVQRDELVLERAGEGSPFLAAHREKVGKDLKGIDRVAKKAAEDPGILSASAPPPGFIHPDGAAPPPAPELTPAPAPDPVPGEDVGPTGEGEQADVPADDGADATGNDAVLPKKDAGAEAEGAKEKEAKKEAKKDAAKKDAPEKDAAKKDAAKKDAAKKGAPKQDAEKKDAPKKDAPKKADDKKGGEGEE